MEFKRARCECEINKRKKEIVDACTTIYDTTDFDDLTITDISEKISIARSSIYTYYCSKEDILLDILANEFFTFNNNIINISESFDTLTKDEYVDKLTMIICSQPRFLKLLAVDFVHIQKNSCEKHVIAFQKAITSAFESFKSLTRKFLTKNEKNIEEYQYAFFSFLNGLHIMSGVSDKQIKALIEINPNHTKPSIEWLCRSGLSLLISGLK